MVNKTLVLSRQRSIPRELYELIRELSGSIAKTTCDNPTCGRSLPKKGYLVVDITGGWVRITGTSNMECANVPSARLWFCCSDHLHEALKKWGVSLDD